MARTKASVGAKISSGKSSKARCSVAPTTSTGASTGSSEKSTRSTGGGNPVCPRETPKWQRPITNFFINKHDDSKSDDDGESAGTSKPKHKRNMILSSDDETSPEKPKNTVLEESIVLETLTGENSHKIEEYYPKGAKGKGVGKRTKDKKGENGSKRGNADSDDKNEGKEDDGEINVENDKSEDENGKESESDKKDDRTRENSVSDSDKDCKSEGKENISDNIEDKVSKSKSMPSKVSKREREDRQEGNVSKKIKVN